MKTNPWTFKDVFFWKATQSRQRNYIYQYNVKTLLCLIVNCCKPRNVFCGLKNEDSSLKDVLLQYMLELQFQHRLEIAY